MKKVMIALLGSMVVGYCGSSPVSAKIIYVNGSATGSNNGTSWADAFTDLQLALGSALSSDEIWVAKGTYKPTTGTNRSISFIMREGVSLYGGFLGNESNCQQRNWNSNITNLSGNIGNLESDSDNSYHVVIGANDGKLDGFVIKRGYASHQVSWAEKTGGGMYNFECFVTIKNCSFTGNYAQQWGGALRNEGGSVIIDNCIFSSNYASAGGAAYNGQAWGHQQYNHCEFVNNEAEQGGAVHDRYTIVSYFNCRFLGNKATYSGGALGGWTPIITIVNSVMVGNYAAKYGGAWHHSSGNDSLALLINSTITHNYAGERGGGIYDDGIIIEMYNSIIWANESINSSQIYRYLTDMSVKNCDVQGGWEGEGNIDENPLFYRIPDDGGDGWSTGNNNDYGDLHLQLGSPCVDAGDNTIVPANITTDYDGNPRIFDGNSDGQSVVDMGAYENQLLASIKVLAPNGGESYIVGATQNITWIANNLEDQLLLQYSVDNGSSWIDVATISNTGIYSWHIPDILSISCLVKISRLDDPSIFDISDALFSIVSPHVYFADANLKLAVESALGISNPTAEDMLKLTYLNAKSKGITSLIGLETALNLTTLNLSENNISDLSPLSGLLKLGSLNLYLNKITDISPLSGLTNLYYLFLNTNKISDISPLMGLVNLTTLSMSYNPITEFSSLIGHTKFKQIYAIRTALLTKETYLSHIPTIRANNLNLTVFQYDPGCQTFMSGDVNQDCHVNLSDLAVIGSNWLKCNHIYEEMCP